MNHTNKNKNLIIVDLDDYLPREFRKSIEKHYYAKVNKALTLENVINDSAFVDDPLSHLALYADHGVNHVRDVTKLALELIPKINGVLIPKRSQECLAFMQGYACLLLYLHDIGMVNTTPFGRAVHAEFAIHEVFNANFSKIVDMVWDNNIGGLALTISSQNLEKEIGLSGKTLLRELMSLAYCHSKRAVPINIIDNRILLQKNTRHYASHSLLEIYWEKQIAKLKTELELKKKRSLDTSHLYLSLQDAKNNLENLKDKESITHERKEVLANFYNDFSLESYKWLTMDSAAIMQFTDDVVDTLRMVRAIDALRQRGTNLKTSGNYQVFIDQYTANAVFALRLGHDKLFLLTGDKPLTAAESNLASASLTKNGDLLFSFHRGMFATVDAIEHAVNNMVLLIEDIQADVIGSFYRSASSIKQADDYSKKGKKMFILLEMMEDNPHFTPMLAKALIKANPTLKSIVKLSPSLQRIPEEERQRYLMADNIEWSDSYKQTFLQAVELTGHKVDAISIAYAFNWVRAAKLHPGEWLVKAGDYAGFVYIPLGPGLRGNPSGGYEAFEVAPMMLLGCTGVIRGDVRNATIVAEQEVQVVIIPKEIYLKYWHNTYTPEEFKQMIKNLHK